VLNASRSLGGLVPVLPSWLIEPLWGQFHALLPTRGTYHPAHPLGCHRRRVGDRVVFDKLVQVLVFGCGYRKIADATCSATTIRDRRDQWIALGYSPRWSCWSWPPTTA
jgi:hypothetical protein